MYKSSRAVCEQDLATGVEMVSEEGIDEGGADVAQIVSLGPVPQPKTSSDWTESSACSHEHCAGERIPCCT